jgi:hypothetical protein
MASSVSCGTRKLAQNSFPLRFDRATEDFTGEFFDEYIDEAGEYCTRLLLSLTHTARDRDRDRERLIRTRTYKID